MTDYNLTLAKLDNGRSEKSLPETMVAAVQAGISAPELQELITLGLQAKSFFWSGWGSNRESLLVMEYFFGLVFF